MTVTPLQTHTLAATPISGVESAAFWCLSALVVLGAVGVVTSRKAVHSAVLMAVVMLGLAVLYGMNEAPFLMVVQIVVYTGAVLMLFLFVLMLVGVSSSDSLVETIRGQRALTAAVAICFLAALATGLTRITAGDPEGLAAGVALAGGNVPWIASEVIYTYIIAFEVTGALLITAVLGALVMAHTARTTQRRTQRQQSQERTRGDHITPLPGPGTYARHNAIDMPALLPDGSVSHLSLNPVLTARDPAHQSHVPDEIQLGDIPEPGGAADAAASKEVTGGETQPVAQRTNGTRHGPGTTSSGTDEDGDSADGQEAPTWTP